MSSIDEMIAMGRKVATCAFAAIDGLRDGTLDRADAMAQSAHLGRVNTMINNELKMRLAAPKIRAQEAKLIEAAEERRALENGDTND